MIQTNTGGLAGSTKVLALSLAALMAAGLLLAPKPAQAAETFTVNDAGDGDDVNVGDGECNAFRLVAKVCTLRAAIQEANHPNNPGSDTIKFEIGGSSAIGVKTITPASELPQITEAVTIDGYSQPGALPNTLERDTNAVLTVELDGSNAGSVGLVIRADDVVVRGLVINRFSSAGVVIFGNPEPTGVKIEGNFIGTDAAGQGDLGNDFEGVLLNTGKNNTIGGTAPEARNLISGNGNDGIELGTGARSNKVEGNLIGTKKDGTSALGNTDDGVDIFDSNNTVGGAAPGAANTIAFNASDGVRLFQPESTGNRILSNSIFSNGELGIDLHDNGRTDNDPRDPDTGPNNLQNFPVVTSAVSSEDGTTTIKGTLDSTPTIKRRFRHGGKIRTRVIRRSFNVQLFSNPRNEDEGKTFLGQQVVVTNLSGKASFTFKTSQPVSANNVTATATGPGGNTSEFSDPLGLATD